MLRQNKRTKPGEYCVKRAMNIRSYTGRAFISKKTGALLRVTMGCRCWKNFRIAFQHYASIETWGRRYWTNPTTNFDCYAEWKESQRLLQNLESAARAASFRFRSRK